MNIPVHVIGTSKGVLNGGILRRNRRKLRVKALPKNLPDFLEADITPLKIGDKLYVTALEGEDYTLLHTDNTVVIQIKTARAAVVEDEEEELEEGAEAAAEGGDAPEAEAQE
jgi:large subunit ribosomal protein L25